jgi:p-aminobenzoyl-glutamate transporter AbgT
VNLYFVSGNDLPHPLIFIALLLIILLIGYGVIAVLLKVYHWLCGTPEPSDDDPEKGLLG